MNSVKSLLALSLALSLGLSLAACGGSAPASSAESGVRAAPSESAPSEEASNAAEITLNVGASPAPHAEILEQVKPILAQQGINLKITEFTDYVLPNKALDAGDIDANYFQHFPYLDNFNQMNGTELVSAAAIHFEPLGLYPGKTTTVDALPDKAIIAVPNDPSNEARALLLLQGLGLIKLADGVGLEATPLDVTENPKNIQWEEIEAAQLPQILPDVDLAVINGNYAVGAGISDKMLTSEDKDSQAAKEFANIVAVREGDEGRPEIQALVKALQSDAVKDYITSTYGVAVIPVF